MKERYINGSSMMETIGISLMADYLLQLLLFNTVRDTRKITSNIRELFVKPELILLCFLYALFYPWDMCVFQLSHGKLMLSRAETK